MLNFWATRHQSSKANRRGYKTSSQPTTPAIYGQGGMLLPEIAKQEFIYSFFIVF
jgi:hypothetical protein